jgi:hypothetical protein
MCSVFMPGHRLTKHLFKGIFFLLSQAIFYYYWRKYSDFPTINR